MCVSLLKHLYKEIINIGSAEQIFSYHRYKTLKGFYFNLYRRVFKKNIKIHDSAFNKKYIVKTEIEYDFMTEGINPLNTHFLVSLSLQVAHQIRSTFGFFFKEF